MEEDWNNIPGVNTTCGNETGHIVKDTYTRWDADDHDDWDLTKSDTDKSNACKNYTNWEPTNDNGHTDDDKIIDKHCDTIQIDGCADWNQTKSEADYQTDTTDLESWGNQISSEQVTNSTDTGYYSEYNDRIEQNSHNYQSNGYNRRGSGYQPGTRFAKNSNTNGNNDKGNGKFEKPIVQKSTYIPPEFEENDDLTMKAGLNFKEYEKIEVTVSGMDVPKNITSFKESGLCEVLLSNLTECNYGNPTPIQKYAIPIIMNGKDMIASAQTGSGKTAAFVLPILNSLISEPSELVFDYNHCEPQCLILSPTRELASQISSFAFKLSNGTSIRCRALYGGTAVYHQREKILSGVHIIVATPGRLIDFVNRGLITFSSLRFIVLDEADRMLDMGFTPAIQCIFSDNTMVSSAERSTLMFSATLPIDVQQIAKSYLKPDYISVAVGEVGGACKDVTQTFVEVNKFSKKNELVALLNETNDCQGTIVFVEQKRQADFIAAFLSELNYPTTSIHGDREQPEREKALRDFKTKKMKVLVATAVAARGLDIMGVTTVVNFDLPKTIEEYVHRIGRTGRLGNSGRAVSFYDPDNDSAMAPYLVNTLKRADQNIPEFLSKYSGEVHEPLNQFNDIRPNVTVTSEYIQEEDEVW
ncbi:ATP-dependent RNA helicase vasa [Acyrthosiphon pisum]|uniref:RNA helicase n=1 Tax=Acyrthosiphon pisum TaxID=7029 RepID=A0A8R2B5Z5_ACYPI|nr:ATP-dependent RNA helicase vasa [Acyrthosiphon pisum]|eukprot:XP_008183055.1 PREDICTED: ATP-dependent RNA helicase vasa [Acyrthosiphon pisum]